MPAGEVTATDRAVCGRPWWALDATLDPRPLALVRICAGVAGLVNAVEVWSQARAVVELDGVVLPQWSWLPALSPPLVHAGLGVGVLLSVLLLLGIWSRPAALGLAALSFGAPLVEQQLYSNHVTLLGCVTLWLACSRCDSAWAMRPPATGRAPVRLRDQLPLMTQVSVVYVATGLVKLNERFLSGDVIAASLRWDLPGEVVQAMAWLAVATELALAVGLWVPRLRAVVAVAGVGLHLSIPVLMTVTAQLIPFSLLMVATYPLFWWRAAERRASVHP